MKKVLSMVLILIMMFSLFAVPAMAAGDNHVRKGDFYINGDMELLDTSYAKWIGVTQVETETVHSGKKAARVESTDPSKKITMQLSGTLNGVFGVVPNEAYTLSAFVYVNDLHDTGKVGLKMEFFDVSNNKLSQIGPVYFDGLAKNKWTEISIDAVAPIGADRAELHLRMDNGGSVIFDDVKFSGGMTDETYEWQKEIETRFREGYELSNKFVADEAAKNNNAVILEGYANTVPNPGFEEADGVKAIGWECLSNAWGRTATVTSEEAHSGNNSLKITSEDPKGTTWARAYVDIAGGSIIPGEDHVLSAWVKYKRTDPNKGAFMKMEPDVSMPGAGQQASGDYLFDDNEWHKISFVFNVNTLTTRIGLLIRLRGTGEIYYDDVTFGPVQSTESIMNLDSDTFFYTESGKGSATAQIDNSKTFIPEGAYVEFEIKDGNTTLVSEKVPAKRTTVWEFDVMAMKELKRPYTLAATYKAADGSILSETKTNDIYRYNRPGALAADGTYMKDGKPFHPYIAYEVIEGWIPRAEEIGINVIRSYPRPVGTYRNVETLRKTLDDAYAKGIMVNVQLYGNEPAGHPIQVSNTRKIVSEFKDHPAVFAWMIMDEPSLHAGATVGVKTYDEMKHWLKQSYIEIRAIDDYHPVYVLETEGQVKNPELYTSRNGDIFATDPYPGSVKQIPTRVANRTEYVVETVDNPNKPIYSIYTTYEQYKPNALYDINIARHQMYQALLAGARGLGIYGFTFETDINADTGKLNMYGDQEIWGGYKQIKESGELAEIVDHFFEKNSPVFNNSTKTGYHYYSWLKNGELYLVVRNMDTTDKTVNVDLTSDNKKVKVEGFTGTMINGEGQATVSGDSNILTLDLGEFETILYKITPNNTLDANKLSLPKYDDLGNVGWAADAIELLAKKRIVNDTDVNAFSPERNITRGEFAYFLMNTLEITGTSGAQQFDDVDPNAFYASAVLAGRKAGILLGNGDGTYSPEEGISRQDAMTICARALKQKSMMGIADSSRILGAFSDNGIIADYAAEHVASMVEEEIVIGNPDGTVNPLGNFTRAEAAVIMERILNLG